MNRVFIMLPLFLILLFTGFSRSSFNLHAITPAGYFYIAPCDSVPELNQKILEVVAQQIDKTVGRGECWDLAALVLNQNGAKWDKQYVFGRKVDPAKDCIYPGDLIQFEGVKIKYTVDRAVHTETMQHHTAVIYEVKAKGVFVLAHQNTGTSGRKVGLSGLDLKTIVSGKYQIYRPEK